MGEYKTVTNTDESPERSPRPYADIIAAIIVGLFIAATLFTCGLWGFSGKAGGYDNLMGFFSLGGFVLMVAGVLVLFGVAVLIYHLLKAILKK